MPVLHVECRSIDAFTYNLLITLSDKNSNLARLEKIRDALGWDEMGMRQEGSNRI
jgi:hypothetical protein